MRKTYIKPSLQLVECKSENLMAVSGVFSDKGIGYGGADENGEWKADSRRDRSIWDE